MRKKREKGRREKKKGRGQRYKGEKERGGKRYNSRRHTLSYRSVWGESGEKGKSQIQRIGLIKPGSGEPFYKTMGKKKRRKKKREDGEVQVAVLHGRGREEGVDWCKIEICNSRQAGLREYYESRRRKEGGGGGEGRRVMPTCVTREGKRKKGRNRLRLTDHNEGKRRQRGGPKWKSPNTRRRKGGGRGKEKWGLVTEVHAEKKKGGTDETRFNNRTGNSILEEKGRKGEEITHSVPQPRGRERGRERGAMTS